MDTQEKLLSSAPFVRPPAGQHPLHRLLPILKYQDEPLFFHVCTVHIASFLRDDHDIRT
jgi:hypothetical protein